MWAKNGSVTLTKGSNIVTGKGTTFSQLAEISDGFIAPDGALYEVVNIVSDTQLTLGRPYAGASGGNLPYLIMPLRGGFNRATLEFQKILSEFGSILSAGLTIKPNASGATADKALFDQEQAGFTFLDVTAGKFFVKLSSADKDWSEGMTVGAGAKGSPGPEGPAGPPVPVAHELGDDPNLAVSQKLLKDSIDTMESSNESIAKEVERLIPLSQEVADRAWAIIRSVETQTDGRMTVRFTKNGQISYFYIVPQFSCEDIAPDGSLGSGPHPAFIFNGNVEPYILVAAYQAAIVDGEVVSQPGLDPANTINYDQALAACRENGAGWDLMSNLDWAAVALWCMANGYQPHGNTYYGLSHDKRFLTGVRQDKQVNGLNSGIARTLTGSGGPQWNHDGLSSGIADMVGNVWEWVSGMKMVDGNVFLAAENGVTDEELYIDTGFSLPASRAWSSVDNEGASDLVKQSLIAPASTGLAPNGRLYTNLEGERLPYRGGGWSYAGSAGLAALTLRYSRSHRATSIGFRARFRDL